MRVSWTTGWPSAVTAIQEVSEARITKVRLATGFGAGGAAEASASGCAASFATEALAALAVADAWEEADGEPGWAPALPAGVTGDEMCEDVAAVVAPSLLPADALAGEIRAAFADEGETLAGPELTGAGRAGAGLAEAGLALLARALRE
jgi:hypothetical protein